MRFWLAGLALVFANMANAHQFETLAVSLEEQPGQLVSVVLKVSLGREDRPSHVAPRLTPDCEPVGNARQERLADLMLRSWTLKCEAGLKGRTLTLEGLGPSTPDAVVIVQYLDGSSDTQVLDRREFWLVLGRDGSSSNVQALAAYIPIGIMHILSGPDHLLFVLCLMLVVASMQFGWGRLLATITAFTLAHSLTLAASVLYGIKLSSSPVEAVIALSILLLTVELARRDRSPDVLPGLSLRYPATVAFAFGLLHGFGFAGALAQIGLPQAAEGWALLLFNLGVEAGQLLFVAAVLAGYWLFVRFIKTRRSALMPAMVTVIGAVSAFWFIDRLVPVFVS